jgi:hypothetical protein
VRDDHGGVHHAFAVGHDEYKAALELPAPDSWWLVFLDNSDQAGALAYHDLTNEGLPLSKVFVKLL